MERENAGQQKLGVTITLMNLDALEAQTSTSGVALGTAKKSNKTYLKKRCYDDLNVQMTQA